MTFSSNVLSIECDGPVGILWLDRPEKRNAMSHEMWTGFPAAISELTKNPDIRAVVIAGRGKSFCSGLDIASVGEAPAQSPPPIRRDRQPSAIGSDPLARFLLLPRSTTIVSAPVLT